MSATTTTELTLEACGKQCFDVPADCVWYAAYGSNMNRERLLDRIGKKNFLLPPNERPLLCTSTLCLTFNKPSIGTFAPGYATLEEGKGPPAEILLWPMKMEGITILDRYEGFHKNSPASSHYNRLLVSVKGSPLASEAYLYLATKPVSVPLLPNADYLGHLLCGASEGLSEKYVTWLSTTALHGVWDVFVYGSLRPDDDSKQPWTEMYLEGLQYRKATLQGAKMWKDRYAFVDLNGDSSSKVVGYLMTVVGGVVDEHKMQQFREKLAHSDRIEGYPSYYDRAVVSATLENGNKVQAYVYHRTGCDKSEATEIPSGDWLKRGC